MSKRKTLNSIILEGNFAKPDKCWIWVNGKTRGGYGRVQHGGRKVLTHRLSYETHVGRIPSGMFINHRCFNRACFNPNHLEIVTRKENNEYMSGQRSDNKSGYRGVSFQKSAQKWKADVRHNNKSIYIGLYATPEEAAAAAHAKRVELGFYEAASTVPPDAP